MRRSGKRGPDSSIQKKFGKRLASVPTLASIFLNREVHPRHSKYGKKQQHVPRPRSKQENESAIGGKPSTKPLGGMAPDRAVTREHPVISKATLARDGHDGLMAAALNSELAEVSPRQRMGFEPEGSGCLGGIDPHLSPPCCFIAAAVNFSMVPTTERHRELVAYLAAKCAALSKTQMMRVRRNSTADQAGLLRNKSDMLAVANPAWLRQHQRCLIHCLRSRSFSRRWMAARRTRANPRLGFCRHACSESSPISPERLPRRAVRRLLSVCSSRPCGDAPRERRHRSRRSPVSSATSPSRRTAEAAGSSSGWATRVCARRSGRTVNPC